MPTQIFETIEAMLPPEPGRVARATGIRLKAGPTPGNPMFVTYAGTRAGAQPFTGVELRVGKAGALLILSVNPRSLVTLPDVRKRYGTEDTLDVPGPRQSSHTPVYVTYRRPKAVLKFGFARPKLDRLLTVAVDTIETSTPKTMVVKGPGYEGVIFSGDVGLSIGVGSGRWSPVSDDVAKAERIVRDQLPNMKAHPDYQQPAVTRIAARLPQYRRQYVGVRGALGSRQIWINFFADAGNQHLGWKTSLVVVKGGGEDYFRLLVDLETGKCSDLQINSPR